MFKESQEYKEILLKCKDILDEPVEFKCYSDKMMIYHHKGNLGHDIHEFVIIADADFYNDMTVQDLLNLKRVGYFQHYLVINNEMSECTSFNIHDKIELN